MRAPKPWFRKQNKTWYVEIGGRQVNLGKDKRLANEKFRKLMADYRPGTVTSRHTVRQVGQAYWEWLKRNRAESTCTRRHPILESFCKSVRAGLRASELLPLHVERWLSENDRKKVSTGGARGAKQAGDRLSPTTINNYIATIKGMMNWAESMGYVDRNPIAKMKKPAARIRQHFVPADMWQTVLSSAKDEAFRDYLTVMLSTGARAMEMRVFEAKHFDGNKFVLAIEASKGKKRSRVVYLPDDALAVVERLIKEYPDGPLFRNADGEPWTKNAVVCRFRRLRDKLKMPGLTATTLRHSYAHHRLTIGQDALTVSKLMGHTSTQMLATRYGHVEANADYMASAANLVSLSTSPAN